MYAALPCISARVRSHDLNIGMSIFTKYHRTENIGTNIHFYGFWFPYFGTTGTKLVPCHHNRFMFLFNLVRVYLFAHPFAYWHTKRVFFVLYAHLAGMYKGQKTHFGVG
ncbi:hypothetical protein HanXRQr2_Chr01g0035261 [Helianthus annuus]|uniref:Uncharacterized protein n=1 Tax=Helianthus annuus TaxID=4232 RepID=A0A9K3JX76_HELAN|nr:hypothetical protein HanXRQr2_Chr01g0035261 [Helianthus annuus]